MSDNTYMIEVILTSGLNRITYATRADAEAAFEAAEPKIGHKFGNDPEMRRHTFKGPDGALAVDMSAVVSIRVVDSAAFIAGMAYQHAADIDLRRAFSPNEPTNKETV